LGALAARRVSGTCAAVGGPIQIGIVEESEPTWHHDGNKLDCAWFIEYFGYSHYAMPIPPTYLQRTQDCFVSVLPQPEGTVVTWFGPSQICSFILDLFLHAEGFDLAAEASFSDEPINAEFFLLFTPEDNGNPWPEPIEVTGEDDSKDSTWLDSDAGEYKQVVNRVSAHLPQEMKYSRSSARYPTHPPGADYCGTDYWYKLKDQNGDPFPGVWIQERFPNPDQLPPNVETNPSNFFWKTTHADGEMHMPDWLRYWWFYGDESIYVIDHDYWAASKLTSGQSGLLVYEGIILLYPGQPGIAGQAP
jgi:hypothetical protein